MSHHHDHNHHHTAPTDLSFQEKMVKLLEHWIKHNEDHSKTYNDWAQKAEDENFNDAVSLLKEASDMTIDINKKFEAALASLK